MRTKRLWFLSFVFILLDFQQQSPWPLLRRQVPSRHWLLFVLNYIGCQVARTANSSFFVLILHLSSCTFSWLVDLSSLNYTILQAINHPTMTNLLCGAAYSALGPVKVFEGVVKQVRCDDTDTRARPSCFSLPPSCFILRVYVTNRFRLSNI